jgi:serine/threonine protein phosphatase PrpC
LPLTLASGAGSDGESTLAIALAERARITIVWAGDSRVYLLDEKFCLSEITRDHVNGEGHITSCVSGNRLAGDGASLVTIHNPNYAAVLGCTDGVHKSCSIHELESFVRWCVRLRLKDSAAFCRSLEGFLGTNAADNFSAALIFRTIASTNIKRLAP